MTSVYEKIDKSVLPTEYLPDDYTGPSAGPLKQIVGKYGRSLVILSTPARFLEMNDGCRTILSVKFDKKVYRCCVCVYIPYANMLKHLGKTRPSVS